MEQFLRNIDFGMIAIQFAVLLFSLSIHEAAHAWAADRFGDYSARYLGRVTLNPIPHIDPIGTILFPLLAFFVNFPLIGWAKPVPINHAHLRNPRKDQIFISLAGPGANLLASGIALILLIALKVSWGEASAFIDFLTGAQEFSPVKGSILEPVLRIILQVMIINLALAIFNILPIPPLDGHWVLYGLLPEDAAAAFVRVGSYGFIILYALMFLGVFRFLFIPVGLAIDLLQAF